MSSSELGLPVSLVSFMLNGHKDDSTCGEADPGYPRRGRSAPISKVGGANLLFWPFSSQKLHEIEKDRTERGRAPLAPL